MLSLRAHHDRQRLTNPSLSTRITRVLPDEWACGAAGSALPWHGRGHRFDPGQVHQYTPYEANICRKLTTPSSLGSSVI